MSESVERLDVVGIGEGQLRLSTSVGEPLADASSLAVHVAGTEGNVLSLLARLGDRTAIVTALPRTSLGERVESAYRRAGVDTSGIVWRESGRVALYFVEHSSPPVPSQVVYDRKGSSFTELHPDDVDWTPFRSARIVHNSGITAALTDTTHSLVRTSIEVAREAGSAVSVDVNHRSLLWDTATATARLTPLLESADIIFCSRRDAKTLFDLDGDSADVAARLSDRFDARTVLTSSGAAETAVVHDGDTFRATPPTTTVVDRVGAGDSLLGGFLHGYLQGDVALGLRLGIASACLALTRHGDQLITSEAELIRVSASLASGLDIIR